MATPKAALGTRWASETDVTERLNKARSNRQGHRRLLDSLHEQTEKRRREVAQSLADIPASQRTPLINKAISGHRRELKGSSADARLAFVREAARHAEDMRSVETHYRSPMQMLARETLGSERRSRIIQQIASSGPAELASLAELAAATGDAELGAALCSRVSEMEPSRRPFSHGELADVLVGERFRTVKLALMEIERLAIEALRDDTRFETGRNDARRDVKIGLMKRAEEAVEAESTADENEEN